MGKKLDGEASQTEPTTPSTGTQFLAIPLALFSQVQLPSECISSECIDAEIWPRAALKVHARIFRFENREKWVTVLGILIGALQVSGIEIDMSEGIWEECEELKKFLSEAEFLTSSPTIPLLLATNRTVKTLNHDKKSEEFADFKQTSALKVYEPLAQQLAEITGRHIVIRNDKEIFQPPFERGEDCIHIFMNHRPPGITTFNRDVKKIFDLHVYEDQTAWTVPSPTEGRGHIIEVEGQDLIQVLGNNFYILIPTLTSFNGVSSVRIFSRILEEVHNYLGEDIHEVAEYESLTPETYEEFLKEQIDAATEEYRERFTKSQDTIRYHQEALGKELRASIQFKGLIKGLEESRETQKAIESAQIDFLQLQKHPHVFAVVSMDDGLHIETHPVILTHENREYNLGCFTIRINKSGKVDVWNDNPRHPKGHHHPHIDRKNLACFGSVSLPISKYASQYRLTEASELILRWLWNYSPETTLNPLEEWPSTPIVKESAISRKETLKEESDGASTQSLNAEQNLQP